MIRVLIADDHALVRHGLRQILNVEREIETVGEAQTGNEVLDVLRDVKVDTLVLDITMPGRNGLETLKEVRRLYPNIAVIVLSMHPKDQYAVRVLKAGASAYISKESAPDELVYAIRSSYLGRKYITSDVAELLADYVQHGSSADPHHSLSDREFEVFSMIASGKGVSQIAEELKLSVKTVSTYKARIAEKTGLSTSSDITRYFLERGLDK